MDDIENVDDADEEERFEPHEGLLIVEEEKGEVI